MSGLEVTMMKRIGELNEEVKLLKAEVKGLTEERCFLNGRLDYFVSQTIKNREQVERLRKAGDAMDTLLGPCHASRQWRAAKEGKPSV